jgi:DNA-binding XRE family transcriptional regulator
VNAQELTAARTRFGLSVDQMAAELGLTPHAYAACEEGRATLPRTLDERLAYRLAVLDREEALAASGLEACTWMQAWERAIPEHTRAMSQHVARAHEHATTCERCIARERFIRERFPAMPAPPMSGLARAARGVTGWIGARPAWVQPAIWGALVLAALTSMRVLMALGDATHDPRVLLVALEAMGLAALGGAVGGIVYEIVGKPVSRVPVVGPYLAGTVVVASYLIAAMWLARLAGAEGSFGVSLASNMGVTLLISVLFGSILGHRLFRRA